jgi:hypothetical protein
VHEPIDSVDAASAAVVKEAIELVAVMTCTDEEQVEVGVRPRAANRPPGCREHVEPLLVTETRPRHATTSASGGRPSRRRTAWPSAGRHASVSTGLKIGATRPARSASDCVGTISA